MLSQILPKTPTEWTYFILIVVLLITLVVFYKGVMKCKHIIECYNDEIRSLKKYYDYTEHFIAYVQSVYPSVMSDYASNSGISEVEIAFLTRGIKNVT